MSEKFPGEFIPASELCGDTENEVTIFNDNGVLYMTGGKGSEKYLYIEDIPLHLENTC